MLFCYIDESGVPQIPGNTSHYVLAGLMMPVNKWKLCETQVTKIKTKYFLQNAEIHTGWIMWPYLEQSKIPDFDRLDHATRVYEVEKIRNSELLRLNHQKTIKQYHRTKKNYRQTKAYIHLNYAERKSFILEIASWGFCRLFSESIDKLHFNPVIAKGTIDEQAFEQVVTRFEHYLKIYSKTTLQKQYGLLIHDNNDTVKNKHTNVMKQFHRIGTLWVDIENIIETPFFVDSQLTSMVQLADVCAYSIRRYLEKKEDYLFKEIFKIADKKNGKVVGVRHFASGCNCLICQSHK